jgi:hypothetical protein
MRPMLNATPLAPLTLAEQNRSLAELKRARAEAQANEELRREKVLAEMDVTRPEAALLSAVHYGITCPPSQLASAAACETYDLPRPVTADECQAALAACLAKGWLQVIDEPGLAKITAELREGRVLGPIYGLPQVGGVDFTTAGAELWQRLWGRLRPGDREPSFAFTDVVHCKFSRYFRTEATALAAIEEVRTQDDVVSLTGPFAVGPWRVQWWRRFPEGYRIDVEERMQWQGRSSGEGTGYFMARSRQKAEAKRLRHILDCHNVTPAEWRLLAAMEYNWDRKSASNLTWRLARTEDEHLGAPASEEECRTGLENCLRYGWLRVVDQHAVNEMKALLRDDPVLLPVPLQRDRQLGEIDFTPCGATLYRMIAAEWLGRDWEDDLCVWKEHYREEHHYCEAETGLQGIGSDYTARGEAIRASRVLPLGPWCVYWWERFPAGYRLELEIGTP